MPQLANDLRGSQITIETLLAGGAKGAVERAPRLRRDAQRASVILRYIDCIHRIAIADIEQPLARAGAGNRSAHDDRSTNLCIMGQHLARGLGKVGHLPHSAREAMMDPAQRLLRPKRLLAALGEEGAHRWLVEVEEVDHKGKSFTAKAQRAQSKKTFVFCVQAFSSSTSRILEAEANTAKPSKRRTATRTFFASLRLCGKAFARSSTINIQRWKEVRDLE